MKGNEIKGHCAMFTANFMWGLISPVAKYIFAASLISPMLLVEMRVVAAAMLFWITSLFVKHVHSGCQPHIAYRCISNYHKHAHFHHDNSRNLPQGTYYLEKTARRIHWSYRRTATHIKQWQHKRRITRCKHLGRPTMYPCRIMLCFLLRVFQKPDWALLANNTHEVDVHLLGRVHHSIHLHRH